MGCIFMQDIYRKTSRHLWAISLYTQHIGKLTDIYGLFLYTRALQAHQRTFIGYIFYSRHLQANLRTFMGPNFCTKKCDVHFYTSHFLIIDFIYTIIFYKIHKIISQNLPLHNVPDASVPYIHRILLSVPENIPLLYESAHLHIHSESQQSASRSDF